MSKYNLDFISDTDLYNHVRETVLQYRRSISLKEFNQNIIDPIKLTFDSKIYGQDIRQTIESECIRQIDKTNNNRIGYFHQYLFKYAGNGWEVPQNGKDGGFDIFNNEKKIYAIFRHKPKDLMKKEKIALLIKCYYKILMNKNSYCYMVDMSNNRNSDEMWKVTIDGYDYFTEHLRIISIDRFYEIGFNRKNAYWKLCEKLPYILNDINIEQS